MLLLNPYLTIISPIPTTPNLSPNQIAASETPIIPRPNYNRKSTPIIIGSPCLSSKWSRIQKLLLLRLLYHTQHDKAGIVDDPVIPSSIVWQQQKPPLLGPKDCPNGSIAISPANRLHHNRKRARNRNWRMGRQTRTSIRWLYRHTYYHCYHLLTYYFYCYCYFTTTNTHLIHWIWICLTICFSFCVLTPLYDTFILLTPYLYIHNDSIQLVFDSTLQ